MTRPGGPFDGLPEQTRSGGDSRRKRGRCLGGLWAAFGGPLGCCRAFSVANAGRPWAAFGELLCSRQSHYDGALGLPLGSLRVAAGMVPGNPSIGNPTR